ncbi:hypothetical protein [Streptomyces longisporoflavus]|uniref:Uncharacterized protein n=1 Tax=Streptomyces longisporoflavus TaxID=28044 RepID=A0ABW7R2J7_9ACTN
MSGSFVWPPRHAAGFPAGCPDAGDSLGRLAQQRTRTVALAVVSSALRASVEDSGDHDAGLRRVRQSLACVARSTDSRRWWASYYGKDLVLTSADAAAPPGLRFAEGVRHGWAWERVELEGSLEERRQRLLAACYQVAMAARLRRDRPEIQEVRTGPLLGRLPTLLNPVQVASLLAGVLVRPLGGEAGVRGAAPGEDPRLPGVPSADGWRDTVAASPPGSFYAVSDVHDIEWGTVRRCDGARLTEGNARQMLPLAQAWAAGHSSTASVLGQAYRLRVGRESDLLEHLRTLSDSVRPSGRLHATLGDGLSGLVPSAAAMERAVTAANRRTGGRMHSGAGLVRVAPSMDASAVAERAHFSLHVTKTLKGTLSAQAAVHEFGTPLGAEDAGAALDFLTALARAPAARAGHHHLSHARRWRHWWLEHVPPRSRAGFARL